MSLPIILGLALLLAAVYAIGVYNALQMLKTQIKAAIQEIGNQLKRQASLLPNLESAVKGYMKHEKDVFQMLTDARKSVMKAEKSGSIKDLDAAVEQMNQLVPRISVAVEDNPEMKADASVAQFMAELRDTADKLMYSRRSVIDLTQNYNVKLVTFPSNLIAGIFGFTEEKGLEMPTSGSHLSVSNDEMNDFKSSM